jgi:hypothetical protein
MEKDSSVAVILQVEGMPGPPRGSWSTGKSPRVRRAPTQNTPSGHFIRPPTVSIEALVAQPGACPIGAAKGQSERERSARGI